MPKLPDFVITECHDMHCRRKEWHTVREMQRLAPDKILAELRCFRCGKTMRLEIDKPEDIKWRLR